jgi:thiamine pyrophosphate-dependent acetolactate synthase large subunit-like protein
VIPGNARVIQVDIEAEEIGRNRNIELGIVSDCGEFLRQANEAAKNEHLDGHEEWLERLSASTRNSPIKNPTPLTKIQMRSSRPEPPRRREKIHST